MNDIELEKMLKQAGSRKVEIPQKVENRIAETIENLEDTKQHNWKYFVKKSMVAAASIITIAISGIGVYAVTGGTIGGKPISELLGIKFSDSYNDYVNKIEGEQVSHSDTSINLISTMCDDGFTVLEFEVKLSEKDKQYLRLGENVYNNEDIEKQRKDYQDEFQNSIRNFRIRRSGYRTISRSYK